ncbi:MAG: ribosome maturation factor RimM [Pseudomonadota bacterium]
MSDVLKAGRFLGAFGIKGWVKVHSETAPKENILGYRPWYLLRGGRWQEVEVAEGAAHGKGLIVRLRGIEDRNGAEALDGVEIGIPVAALPKLKQGEFYWRDLIGLKVVNTEGVLLGVVDHLLETGANDVLVVLPCDGSVDDGRRLVPWVQGPVVQRVDADARVITVDWGTDW